MKMITFDEIIKELQPYHDKYSNYRLYVLIRDQYPPSVAINSTAHGAMGAEIMWRGIEDFEWWKLFCYKKVTCSLSDEKFIEIDKVLTKNKIRNLPQTEGRLNKAHILTIVFPIDMTLRENKAFKYLPLYK